MGSASLPAPDTRTHALHRHPRRYAQADPSLYISSQRSYTTNTFVTLCKSSHAAITHHQLIASAPTAGINKFYLTDTGSKPPMQGVLEDYIASSLVEYTFETKVRSAPSAVYGGIHVCTHPNITPHACSGCPGAAVTCEQAVHVCHQSVHAHAVALCMQ